LSRAVESLVEAKEVQDEESSALLPPECAAAQMGAEDRTRAEKKMSNEQERKAKAEASAQIAKERKRQARLASQARRAAALLNPVQPVAPNQILVKEESTVSRRTSEQRQRKKKRIFGADEENDNTVVDRKALQKRFHDRAGCPAAGTDAQRNREGPEYDAAEKSSEDVRCAGADAKRIRKGGGSRSRSKGGRGEVGANKKLKSGMEQLLEPVLPAYTSFGAKCEVESNGEWWDATVAARYKDRLCISYVGGDSGDDEWLFPEEHWFLVPEDHWCSRMRAVQEGDASSQSYRGVEPLDGGLWCSVVKMFPHNHNITGDPNFWATDTAARKQFSDDASGGEGRRAAGGSALNPAAIDKVLLGTFTSAREAAQHYDCVMLECVSVDHSADMCLNLDSSRDYFRQCKANGRAIFPESIDAATRETIKDVFLAQFLSPRPNLRSAPQAPC
jgi:hypothetical protein